MSFNEKHPWGKPGPNSTIVGVSQDNIVHAQIAREARARIAAGRPQQGDIEFVQEREALIKKAAGGDT